MTAASRPPDDTPPCPWTVEDTGWCDGPRLWVVKDATGNVIITAKLEATARAFVALVQPRPVAPDDTPTRLQQIRSWVDQNRPYPAFMSSIAGEATMFLLQQLDELRAEVSRLRARIKELEDV